MLIGPALAPIRRREAKVVGSLVQIDPASRRFGGKRSAVPAQLGHHVAISAEHGDVVDALRVFFSRSVAAAVSSFPCDHRPDERDSQLRATVTGP